MTRRIPVVATIVVAAAVALMIGLGIWQLERAKWKEGLLAQYAREQNLPPIGFPGLGSNGERPFFRRAIGTCARIIGRHAQVGENAAGEPGYVQIFDCYSGGDFPIPFSVEVGWSKNPNAAANWGGGPVSGIVAPDRLMGMRLVAAEAPPGLEPSKAPSPDSIPNNHRSYAVQWFSFAAIAIIIYGLALRKRIKEQPEP